MHQQALRQPVPHAGCDQSPAPADSLADCDEASTIDAEIWGVPAAPPSTKEEVVRIVDGGAFAWTYGLVPFSGWLAVRQSYSSALICWDSDTSIRRDGFAGYKGRREERRKSDPERARRRERVKEFITVIRQDPMIAGCYLEGYEADDLVALHYLHALAAGERVAVYGIDKDLLQLPGIVDRLRNFDGSPRELVLTDYPKRAPLYWPGTRDHRDLLLYQLLFGDRSDSIARLLLKGDKVTARRIHRARFPFLECYERWGARVIASLMLLLMPSPTLSSRWPDYHRNPESLLMDLENDEYWSAAHFPHDCQSGNSSEILAI